MARIGAWIGQAASFCTSPAGGGQEEELHLR